MILSSHGIIGSQIAPDIPFQFTVDTANTSTGSSNSDQFKLPLTTSTGLDCVVDWGDGTSDNITSHTALEVTHTYDTTTTTQFTIRISGDLLGWRFYSGGDRLKMLDVQKWGVLNISTYGGFYGCTNLTCSATDAPTITSTSLFAFFQNCSNFNGAIGNWDVSSVTNMSSMFNNATTFNQNIGAWNVSNVAGPVSNSAFYRMFYDATSFNNGGSDDIDNWTFSTSNKKMEGMFSGSNTTTSCKFNRYIGSWNIQQADMSSMFRRNTLFNQDIGSWDVSNIGNMSNMFNTASSFDQDIGSWNTSSVTRMDNMFNNADAFDQDISSWDINQVKNFSGFMTNATGLSTTNYDLLLVGWEANLQALYPGGVGYPYTISINFGGSTYTLGSAAETARTSLISTYGWTITDGGGV